MKAQSSSNHNSHKHNWNFIERKTTGSIFFRHYHQKGVTCQSPAEDILAALYSTQTPRLSRRVHGTGCPMWSCVPSCPRPLLVDAWKFAFNGEKQQEKLYSKTKTDGANKALLFQLAWLLTILVQVMRGNVTCHPIGLVVSWRRGLSPLVTTNETEPEP